MFYSRELAGLTLAGDNNCGSLDLLQVIHEDKARLSAIATVLRYEGYKTSLRKATFRGRDLALYHYGEYHLVAKRPV